ncbi:A-kinase-interacting protein 1-like [Asterias amurensis]|uniref:A-kinase-interacting protein 1-like n=2 Tax=Asterias TaxID=7601 RepID=UPI003AB4A1CA
MMEDWMSCTLCRTGRQGLDVLQRAQQRKVEWPQQPHHEKSPIQDPMKFTTIDDAFSSILQYMSTTTRQCRRYYRSAPPAQHNPLDKQHTKRFHTPQYTEVHKKHPLLRSEDVHVMVAPGTYAVTAGAWGTSQQQTHVVHVNQGQSVDLDFVL